MHRLIMQSSKQCCAGRFKLMKTLCLLSLLCGAVAGPWPDTWRPYHEPSDGGGGAAVAWGRTSDQQWQHQQDQQPADGTIAWELHGKDPSEENQDLAGRLAQAFRSSWDDTDNPIQNIAQDRQERNTAVPSDARQARTTTAGQDRCSCQYTDTSYDDHYNGKTTLTIVLWAVLALAAWYTPVTTNHLNPSLKNNADFRNPYKDLQEGIARWSASFSEEQTSPSTSRTARHLSAASSSGYDEGHHVTDMFSDLTGRRRRSLSPRASTRWRNPVARGAGITQTLQRMGRTAFQTASAVPDRLTSALQSWSLPSLWSSSGGASPGAGLDRSDTSIQSGVFPNRQRTARRISQQDHYQSSYGHDEQHYAEDYSYDSGHHAEECYCGQQQHGKGRELQRLTKQLLHNSYWIPAVGLCLLVAEEALWRAYGSINTSNNFVVNGFVKRSFDHLQSVLQSSQQQTKHR